MVQVEQGPFGLDEVSAVLTTPAAIGLREDTEVPEFSDEECDASLSALDVEERVEEARDAVKALPASVPSNELMQLAIELLGRLDDERAIAAMVERGCRLSVEDTGSLARQLLLVLWNQYQQYKRAADAARELQRTSEVALIEALGPCAGLAFEAAE